MIRPTPDPMAALRTRWVPGAVSSGRRSLGPLLLVAPGPELRSRAGCARSPPGGRAAGYAATGTLDPT